MAEMNTGRAFNWNDTIQNDSGDFILLPDGNYPFTVVSFERGEFAGSDKLPPCKKAILTIDVDGGVLGVATIQHNLFLHSRCEGLLCAFFLAIGLRKHGEPLAMPWQQVAGRRGMCKIGSRKWKTRNGNDATSNQIEQFLDPEKYPLTAPAGPSYSPGQF